ncbi:MAG: FkbM family methyltransferase [Pelagimonas sp.]|jgi:FkbM family methyltransferase|nr:FkbM family methyltransferase [Pelagimonas sp.]
MTPDTAPEHAPDSAPIYQQIDTRHGRFLVNPRDAYIGKALVEYGEFSQIELALLLRLTKPGDTVVEIGSNIGAHSVALARHLGVSGRLHAFEPQPLLFQNLCANLALNGITRAQAHNAACGAQTGTLSLPDLDPRRAGNFGALSLLDMPQPADPDGLRVPVMRLDDLGLRTASLIKIDVEGMEFDVLRGAARLIEQARPILYVENDRLALSERLIKLIQSFGYRLWWHCPPLFNPDNFAGRDDNLWPGVLSVNMLCVHGSVPFEIDGAQEITDPAAHPMKATP